MQKLVGFKDVVRQAVRAQGRGCVHVNTRAVSSLSFPRTPNLGYSFETNSGNPFHYFSYGVACSEVEIDCLTGDHKVRSCKTLVLSGKERETTEW